MNIYIGSDHVGFEFKPYWGCDLASEHERYICEHKFNKPCIVYNYPKNIKAFYMKLNSDNETVQAMDILVPGIGISIAANKIKNIRCALIHDIITSEFSKKHNNANIIALGNKVVNKKYINVI